MLHFYNIHVSPSFARAHPNQGTEYENPVNGGYAASTPLLEAYTRYCVSEFVKSYPNVGVMLTAGEACRLRRRSSSATP